MGTCETPCEMLQGWAWPRRRLGESLQIIVIEDKTEYQKGLTAEQLSERQRVPVDFHAIINPQIDLLTPPDVSFYEGCLSIPRLMAMVAQSRSVRVTCLDEHGEQRVIEAAGWYARILQHEIDHLHGRLYTDTMQPETLTTIDNHQRNNSASISAKTANGTGLLMVSLRLIRRDCSPSRSRQPQRAHEWSLSR